MAVALLFYSLFAAVYAATQCPDPSFCVSVTPNGQNVIISVSSSQPGWAGLGIGTLNMRGNAPTYIGYTNPSGGVTVSKRITGGHYSPTFMEAVSTVSTPSGVNAMSGLPAPPAVAIPFPSPTLAIPSIAPTSTSSFAATITAATATITAVAPPPAAPSASFCSDAASTFCITASKDASGSILEFAVTSTAKGYVSFGTGSFMDGSTMVVGWRNGNATVISQRTGHGHDQPTYNASPIFTQVTRTNATLNGISFAIQIPTSSNLVSLTSATFFIFAVGDVPPASPSDSSSPIQQHSRFGSFSIDFSQATLTTGIAPIDRRLTLLLVHGACMFLAWAVVPPIAIFVARYLKKKWGHRWFLTHSALFVLGTGGLMVIALTAVEVQMAPGVTRFIGSSNHGILGTVIALILYPLQCVLGWLSDKWFDQDRLAVPWWDKLHWFVGRSVVLMAIVNIHLGIVEYGGWIPWVTAYWIWIAAVVLIGFMWFGERKLGGQVNHIGNGDVIDLDLVEK
ncbi:UNVERIFIED_CONTAM: hypothetical protein HDU68_005828 [Siphonaria sp. JEL0065]|nr:hypothetical protein HDU68_005828 [Siphonaria sp. JEL0065]